MRALVQCPRASTTKASGRRCRRDSSRPTSRCAGASCWIACAPAIACWTSAAARGASRPSWRARARSWSASTSPRSRCAARGSRHPELDLRLVDGEGPWELADACFDVVWAGEVIEHVADTAAWLSEVRRVLRSGASAAREHARARAPGAGCAWRSPGARSPSTSTRSAITCASTAATRSPGCFQSSASSRSRCGAPAAPPGARRLLLAHAIRSRF